MKNLCVYNTPFFITINQEQLQDATSRLRLKLKVGKVLPDASGNFQIDMQEVRELDEQGLALLADLKKISLQKGIELEFINFSATLLTCIVKAGMHDLLKGTG